MQKYTANYSFTNPNFVIQNLVENPIKSEYLSVYFVVKNLLQRGFPTILSKYLQNEIGEIHKQDDFKEPFLLIDTKTPIWHNTIKGGEEYKSTILFKGKKIETYNPAKFFFEEIIPEYFGEYTFIQNLILPEMLINDITDIIDENYINELKSKFTDIGLDWNEETENSFKNQQVDFYLPQAKLVIEIDGSQHKESPQKELDASRDNHLKKYGVKTVRISTIDEFKDGSFVKKINEIIEILQGSNLKAYQINFDKIKSHQISPQEYQEKLLPTAIIRFQVLVLELLISNYISINDKIWNFNIIERDIENFAELAIQDLFLWIENLCQLQKLPFQKPNLNIVIHKIKARHKEDYINVDFSLFKRYTDENNLEESQKWLFVRTDYFGFNFGSAEIGFKNYFQVSVTNPIAYKIISDDEKDKNALRFFLQNIFEKDDFRDGQYPIIVNALQRKDTIGLLPTGGGKSICYQLPCLLQPSINFVVCPIKSLMYDQKENLDNSRITNTNYISSSLNSVQREKIQQEFSEGKYLFIWVSPERFQIKVFREYLSKIQGKIAYAVIDEVHCLSEWGHDFRTSYLTLSKTIQRRCKNAIFIGLTATASVNVLKDIRVEFSRNNFEISIEDIKTLPNYSRKELNFEVIKDEGSKRRYLEKVVKDFYKDEISNDKACLIFTPNASWDFGCYRVSNYINTIYPNKSNWFAGDIPRENQVQIMNEAAFETYRDNVQKGFKKNIYPILVATKAFGMGIDKQNIYFTIHYGLPSSAEALYQEAGRAGRWNTQLPENQDKKANCVVLYSKEFIEDNILNEVFAQETSANRLKQIVNNVGFNGNDIFRQLFLFTKGQRDYEETTQIILTLLNKYIKPKSNIVIFWTRIEEDLLDKGITLNEKKSGEIEKAIYRLSLLGIVDDWEISYRNQYYEVFTNSFDENTILQSLSKYIQKYEPLAKVEEEVKNNFKPTIIEKCIWYLIEWTWNKIAFNRRESLNTLSKWCQEFENSEDFKRRLDSYFRFNDITFTLQYIAEKPLEYNYWFEIFYKKEIEEESRNDISFFIPDLEQFKQWFFKYSNPKNEEYNILDEQEKTFKDLKASLARFKESFQNNIGFDLIDSILGLFLNDFKDIDKLEKAISSFPNFLSSIESQKIIDELLLLGTFMNEDSKYQLAKSITKFYPEKLELLAEKFNIIYLLEDKIADKVQLLKAINQQFYEQLTKI